MCTPYLSQSSEDSIEALAKMPVNQRGEYLGHGGVIKGLYRDYVEMSGEPSCDVVTPTTRRTHRTHQQLDRETQTFYQH